MVNVEPNSWKPPRRSHRARPQLAVTCWSLRRRHAQIVYLPASIDESRLFMFFFGRRTIFIETKHTAATINGIPQRAFLLPHSRPSFGRPKSSSALFAAWTKRKHKDALTARATGWCVGEFIYYYKRIIIMLLKLRPRVAKTGWELEAVVYLWKLFSGTNKWRGTRRRGKYVCGLKFLCVICTFSRYRCMAEMWTCRECVYKISKCVHWNHLVHKQKDTCCIVWFRLLRVIYAK